MNGTLILLDNYCGGMSATYFVIQTAVPLLAQAKGVDEASLMQQLAAVSLQLGELLLGWR